MPHVRHEARYTAACRRAEADSATKPPSGGEGVGMHKSATAMAHMARIIRINSSFREQLIWYSAPSRPRDAILENFQMVIRLLVIHRCLQTIIQDYLIDQVPKRALGLFTWIRTAVRDKSQLV